MVGTYMLDRLVENGHSVHSKALIESKIRFEGDAVRSGRVNDAPVEFKHGLAYSPPGLHALGDLGEIGVQADA